MSKKFVPGAIHGYQVAVTIMNCFIEKNVETKITKRIKTIFALFTIGDIFFKLMPFLNE